MIRRSTLWLACAFVAGFFLVGLPHWAPSARFLDPPMILALAGLAAMAMMLVVGEVASAPRAWLIMALCMPTAAIAGIIEDVARDPTSHHLWPFELVVALMLGGFAVAPGAFAGLFSQRLQNRDPG